MDLARYVLKENIIKEDAKIGVALSGGIDSVALLVIFKEISELINIKLFAVHINHNIREASKSEEVFVNGLCEDMGVECLSYHISPDVYRLDGSSTEEIARIERYKIFDKIIEDRGCQIALGHHLEDNAETVFMNIIRGAGLGGLTGISRERDSYIRPLLDFHKADLEAYLRERGISNITDESNFDVKYTRNKIRHEVFPYLNAELGIDISKKLSDMASLISDDEDYLNGAAREIFERISTCDKDAVSIDIDPLSKEHIAVKKRIIRLAIARLYPSLKDVSRGAISQVLELIGSENGSADILAGIGARKVYDKLEIFLVKERGSLANMQIDKRDIGAGGLSIGGFLFKVFDIDSKKNEEFPKNTFKKWLDYDKFNTLFNIRTRESGDYISIRADKSSAKKSIKKYFIDEKIREDKRDEIYLLADGSSVAWIVGYRIGEDFKIDESSKKILEVEFIGEKNE